jgi:hypothetical protein
MSTATKTKLLSREDILNANDRRTDVEDVPEWGGQIKLRALSGVERDHYLATLYTMKSNGKGGMEIASVSAEGSQARLVAMSAIDETGERLFSEADVVALGEKDGAVLSRVATKASELSRLATTIEGVKADLGVAQNVSSGSV